ncbi:putative metal-binding protein [Knoellia koreensis]|uniref:Metal binding domain-containing protein n=1 Tax=Knoellia koreensis TaxID=2730921 RepID=A0A849HL00_9MICO|nr:hypothetical protein [Knoellia sp. DB2414S]
MHPVDVAEHVAHGVAELRRYLREYPTLAVGEPELQTATDLLVRFEKVDRTLVRQAVPSTLLRGGPGPEQVAFIHEVPLVEAEPRTRQLVLHLNFDDYDGQPPSAELRHPDLTPLAPNEWPKALNGPRGIIRNHPDYQRPFFCRRGLREYHSHPQHQDDPWDKHREELRLDALVLELLVDLKTRWIGR